MATTYSKIYFLLTILIIRLTFIRTQFISVTDSFPADLDLNIEDHIVSRDAEELFGLQYLHLMNVTSLTSKSILISWKVDSEFRDTDKDCKESNCEIDWDIIIHDSQRKLRLKWVDETKWNEIGVVHVEAISGLKSGTIYKICLSARIQGQYYYSDRLCATSKTAEYDKNLDFKASTHNYLDNIQDKRNGGLIITKSTHSINIFWKSGQHTENLGSIIGWKIRYRKFAESNETEIVLYPNEENHSNVEYNYTIDDLESNTGFILCFKSIVNDQIQHDIPPGVDLLRSNDGVTKSNQFDKKDSGSNNDLSVDENTVGEVVSSSPSTETFPRHRNRNFVYTSTGERVELPSNARGPFVAGSFPVVAPVFANFPVDSSTNEGLPFENESPFLRQRPFTNNFRGKRSSNDKPHISDNEIYQFDQCYEIVTEEDIGEYLTEIALMIAVIISMLLTLIFLIFCCLFKKCNKNKQWTWCIFNGKNKIRKISSISAPVPTNLYNCNITDERFRNGTLPRTHTRKNNSATVNSYPGHYRSNEFEEHSSHLIISQAFDEKPLECRKRSLSNMNNQKVAQGLIFDNKDEILKEEKIDFHPGYDVPPSTTKKILGYDYPCSFPANGPDQQSNRTRYPSRSSCDSNWNNNNDSLSQSVNYNIPYTETKSSDSYKDVSYEYVSPEEISVTKMFYKQKENDKKQENQLPTRYKQRRPSYLKNSQLSRSVPNLQEYENQETKEPDSLPFHPTDNGPVRVTHLPSIPRPVRIQKNTNPQYLTRINTSEIDVTTGEIKDSDSKAQPFSEPAAKLQAIGDITLSGGTLIEVPDGYVVPGSPKPSSSAITVTVSSDDSSEN